MVPDDLIHIRETISLTVKTVADFIFWAPKSLQMVITAMKLKDAYSLEGKLWPRASQESSPTPQFKSIISSALSLLHSPTLTSIHFRHQEKILRGYDKQWGRKRIWFQEREKKYEIVTSESEKWWHYPAVLLHSNVEWEVWDHKLKVELLVPFCDFSLRKSGKLASTHSVSVC